MNIYAVGTYVDKSVIESLDEDARNSEDLLHKAICSPITIPRTIRIVIHWNVPMYLVTKGITDAIRPRLVDKISNKEMKELENKLHSLMNSKGDVGVGTEILLTINGDSMYYSNGGNGTNTNNVTINEEKKIRHQEFCFALCDVYYGNDAVSTDHKENVIKGILTLL